MANDFEVGVDVAVPPDAAWALAGDPARVTEWFTAAVECTVEGDERRVTLGNGASLVERLVDRDEAGRRVLLRRRVGHPRPHQPPGHHPGGARRRADRGCCWRQTATSEVEGYDIETPPERGDDRRPREPARRAGGSGSAG